MSNVKILSQYIKDLSFEVPQAPQVFFSPINKPNIALNINIDAKKISDENYEILLKINAEATQEEKKIFICEVEYGGLFQLQKIENEMLEQVLLIYCPNILFPFIRRVIANVTSDGGFAPLMLDLIDFADLYNRRKNIANATPISNTQN